MPPMASARRCRALLRAFRRKRHAGPRRPERARRAGPALCLYWSRATDRSMNEGQDRPVSRQELVFTIRMALFNARRLWPKARPGDHDLRKPIAATVADHMDRCGMRCIGKDPGIGPSASNLRPISAGMPRQASGTSRSRKAERRPGSRIAPEPDPPRSSCNPRHALWCPSADAPASVPAVGRCRSACRRHRRRQDATRAGSRALGSAAASPPGQSPPGSP